MPESPEPALDLLLKPEEIQDVTNKQMPVPIAASIAVLATDAVRDYCGWRVAKAEEETITVTGTGRDRIFLPTLHLNGVVMLTDQRDGDPLIEGTDFDWDFHGVVDRIGRRWSTHRRGITAVVNHGYEKCPGGIAQAIAAAVARGTLAPAAGVTAESTLSASVQYSRAQSGAAAGSIFLPHELAQLDAHRIPQTR